jgi:UDP-N-acetylmuramate dehydrogenase
MPNRKTELKPVDINNLLDFLKEHSIPHLLDADIRPFVSIRIGGRVKLIVIVRKIRELEELVIKISENKIPRVLIGGGTNVVFPDDYSPLAVIINRTTGISKLEDHLIRVNSGVSNQRLISWCLKNNISGLEFLAGIPGTIGGAAAVNAGAFGKSISDNLQGAEILDETNTVRQVEKDFFQYDYRHSVFRTGSGVILNLILSHQVAEKEKILKEVKYNIQYRKKSHPPYSQFTAGCFFKNPLVQGKRISAGKIIQNSDLDGLQFGKLKVSEKHANFIINTGNAFFQDIRSLETEIITRISRGQGTRLEREVIYISPDGRKY